MVTPKNPDAKCHPRLHMGPNGQWLPKLSPAQKEAVAFGYPDLSNEQVAMKFGISKTAAHYLRSGERGMVVPNLDGPEGLKLNNMRAKTRHGAAALSRQFLARAVPLLRTMLRAKARLEQGQPNEESFIRPIEVRHGPDSERIGSPAAGPSGSGGQAGKTAPAGARSAVRKETGSTTPPYPPSPNPAANRPAQPRPGASLSGLALPLLHD